MSNDSSCNAGGPASSPGWGRSPGGGHGNPLQHSCLENPMDRAAWWATVQRVMKSWTPPPTHTQSDVHQEWMLRSSVTCKFQHQLVFRKLSLGSGILTGLSTTSPVCQRILLRGLPTFGYVSKCLTVLLRLPNESMPSSQKVCLGSHFIFIQ